MSGQQNNNEIYSFMVYLLIEELKLFEDRKIHKKPLAYGSVLEKLERYELENGLLKWQERLSLRLDMACVEWCGKPSRKTSVKKIRIEAERLIGRSFSWWGKAPK